MTNRTTTIEAVSARRVWDSRGRPTVEAEVRLGGGVSGARHRAGRGLDRQRRGGRPARRRTVVRRPRRDGRRSQRQPGDRPGAAGARRRGPGRPRSDAGRPRRYPEPEPARRQRPHRRVDGSAARRPPARLASHSGGPSWAASRRCSRCRRSRSSAAAPTPAAGSTSRTSW